MDGRRACAVFLAVCLLPIQGLYAAPSGGSILPVFKTETIDLRSINLDAAFGEVVQSYTGTGERTFLLIQDAHSIPDAQKSIHRLLRFFMEKYGVGIVGVEGAAEALDPQFFKSFPDTRRLKKVFSGYLGNGELPGAVASAIFNDRPASYIGIEDWPLYEEQLRAFLESIDRQTFLQQEFEKTKLELQELKKETYSPGLLEVDRALLDFHKGESDLLTLISKLAEIVPVPKGSRIEPLYEEWLASRNADEGTVSIELNSLAKKVASLLNHAAGGQEAEITSFNAEYQAYKTGRMPDAQFALILHRLIEERNLPVEMSRSLYSAASRQKKIDQIKGTLLFSELKNYGEAVFLALVDKPEQAAIHKKDETITLLEKLAALELDRAGWRQASALRDNGFSGVVTGAEEAAWEEKVSGWLPKLKPHYEFYRLAESREHAFIEKITNELSRRKETTVLAVVGGFHAEGLVEEITRRGDSYLLLTPKIGELPETLRYTEHMRGDVSWKSYYRVENGRINVYDAFLRATRDRLLEGPDGRADMAMLKEWRDRLIRDLARQGRVHEAADYTIYLDELLEKNGAAALPESEVWTERIQSFIERLRGLEKSGRWDKDAILKVLTPSAAQPAFLVGIAHTNIPVSLVPASVFAARSELRTLDKNEIKQEIRKLLAKREAIIAQGQAGDTEEAFKLQLKINRLVSRLWVPAAAIGDLHANPEVLKQLLDKIGGEQVIVQVGDRIDRGPDPFETDRILREKQRELNAKQSGMLLTLAGNHELMLVLGFLGDNRQLKLWYTNLIPSDRERLNLPKNVLPTAQVIKTALAKHPEYKPLIDQLLLDMLNGDMLAAVAVQGRLYTHAGIRSQLMEELEADILAARGVDTAKMPKEEIAAAVSEIEIAEYLNVQFRRSLAQAVVLSKQSKPIENVLTHPIFMIVENSQGIFWQRQMTKDSKASRRPQAYGHSYQDTAGEGGKHEVRGQDTEARLIALDVKLQEGGNLSYLHVTSAGIWQVFGKKKGESGAWNDKPKSLWWREEGKDETASEQIVDGWYDAFNTKAAASEGKKEFVADPVPPQLQAQYKWILETLEKNNEANPAFDPGHLPVIASRLTNIFNKGLNLIKEDNGEYHLDMGDADPSLTVVDLSFEPFNWSPNLLFGKSGVLVGENEEAKQAALFDLYEAWLTEKLSGSNPDSSSFTPSKAKMTPAPQYSEADIEPREVSLESSKNLLKLENAPFIGEVIITIVGQKYGVWMQDGAVYVQNRNAGTAAPIYKFKIGETIKFGREAANNKNDIIVTESTASRNHASVRVDAKAGYDGVLTVEDLASKNGTKVNWRTPSDTAVLRARQKETDAKIAAEELNGYIKSFDEKFDLGKWIADSDGSLRGLAALAYSFPQLKSADQAKILKFFDKMIDKVDLNVLWALGIVIPHLQDNVKRDGYFDFLMKGLRIDELNLEAGERDSYLGFAALGMREAYLTLNAAQKEEVLAVALTPARGRKLPHVLESVLLDPDSTAAVKERAFEILYAMVTTSKSAVDALVRVRENLPAAQKARIEELLLENLLSTPPHYGLSLSEPSNSAYHKQLINGLNVKTSSAQDILALAYMFPYMSSADKKKVWALISNDEKWGRVARALIHHQLKQIVTTGSPASATPFDSSKTGEFTSTSSGKASPKRMGAPLKYVTTRAAAERAEKGKKGRARGEWLYNRGKYAEAEYDITSVSPATPYQAEIVSNTAKFREFEDQNDRVLKLLGKPNKTVADLQNILRAMDEFVKNYTDLFGPYLSQHRTMEMVTEASRGWGIIKSRLLAALEANQPGAKSTDFLRAEVETIMKIDPNSMTQAIIARDSRNARYEDSEFQILSVNQMVNVLHQKGVRNLNILNNGLGGQKRDVDIRVKSTQLGSEEKTVRVQFLDARSKPDGQLPVPVRFIAEAFAKGQFQHGNEEYSLKATKAQIWADDEQAGIGIQLGVHSVRIQFSYKPLGQGGRVVVNYTDSGGAYDPGSGLRTGIMEDFFKSLGFKVHRLSHHIDAYYDKESPQARMDLLPQQLERAIQALSALKDIDLRLSSLVNGINGSGYDLGGNFANNREIADAAFGRKRGDDLKKEVQKKIGGRMAADGYFVFDAATTAGSRGRFGQRTLDAAIDAPVLQELNQLADFLGVPRLDAKAGQLEIDRVMDELDRQFARGAVRQDTQGRLYQNPLYLEASQVSPVQTLFSFFEQADNNALESMKRTAMVARAVQNSSVERNQIAFFAGFVVEQMKVPVYGDVVTFFSLRSQETGEYVASYAVLGDFYAAQPRYDAFRQKTLRTNMLGIQDLSEILGRQNMGNSEPLKDWLAALGLSNLEKESIFDLVGNAAFIAKASPLFKITDLQKKRTGQQISDVAIGGISMNQGTALARAKTNRKNAATGAYEGQVFISDHTDNEDNWKIGESSAAVATDGDPLSHTAVQVREKGKPGIITKSAKYTGTSLQFEKFKGKREQRQIMFMGEVVNYYEISDYGTETAEIKDGDLLYIDATKGFVYVIASAEDTAASKSFDAYQKWRAGKERKDEELRNIVGGITSENLMRAVIDDLIQNRLIGENTLEKLISHLVQTKGRVDIILQFVRSRIEEELETFEKRYAKFQELTARTEEKDKIEELYLKAYELNKGSQTIISLMKLMNGEWNGGKSQAETESMVRQVLYLGRKAVQEYQFETIRSVQKQMESIRQMWAEVQEGRVNPADLLTRLFRISRRVSLAGFTGAMANTSVLQELERIESDATLFHIERELNRIGRGVVPKELLDRFARIRVGGKASNSGEIMKALRTLSELLQGKVRVPEGFAIQVREWELWMGNGKPDTIDENLQVNLNASYAGLVKKQVENALSVGKALKEKNPEIEQLLQDFIDSGTSQLSEANEDLRNMADNIARVKRGIEGLQAPGEQALEDIRAGLAGLEKQEKRMRARLAGTYKAFDVEVARLRAGIRKIMSSDKKLPQAFKDQLNTVGSVAVRSSGVIEDGADNAKAGENESKLNVIGTSELGKAVREVWASGAQAILIEEMISPEIAFIAFSADPVTGNVGHMRFSVTYGHPHALVAGTVDADKIVVEKKPKAGKPTEFKVVAEESQPGTKDRIYSLNTDSPQGGLTEQSLSDRYNDAQERSKKFAVSDQQINSIASVIDLMAQYFGHSIDSEGVILADGTLVILQIREETTIKKKAEEGRSFLTGQTKVRSELRETAAGASAPEAPEEAGEQVSTAFESGATVVPASAVVAQDVVRYVLGVTEGQAALDPEFAAGWLARVGLTTAEPALLEAASLMAYAAQVQTTARLTGKAYEAFQAIRAIDKPTLVEYSFSAGDVTAMGDSLEELTALLEAVRDTVSVNPKVGAKILAPQRLIERALKGVKRLDKQQLVFETIGDEVFIYHKSAQRAFSGNLTAAVRLSAAETNTSERFLSLDRYEEEEKPVAYPKGRNMATKIFMKGVLLAADALSLNTLEGLNPIGENGFRAITEDAFEGMEIVARLMADQLGAAAAAASA